jgi:hypothetical protein
VALGKALLFTLLGMALATSVAYVSSGGQLLVAIAAGIAGFLLTALVLRWRAAPPKREAVEVDD